MSAPIPDGRTCEDCGTERVWAWSMEQERYLLRRCPCRLPKHHDEDEAAARERIAQIKQQLATKEQP